jgi:uncharacterized membrane protein
MGQPALAASTFQPRARETFARVWWLVVVLVGTTAVVVEGGLWLVNPSFQGTLLGRTAAFFSYFTIQSNVLVVATSIPLIFNPRHDGPLWRVARLDAIVGIAVTGIVFAAVLAPLYHPTGWSAWTNFGLHYVMPLFTVVGWLALGPHPRFERPIVAKALVWPLLWIAWTFARGAATGAYPYPFLDVTALGWPKALANTTAILLIAVGLIALVRRLDRRRGVQPIA